MDRRGLGLAMSILCRLQVSPVEVVIPLAICAFNYPQHSVASLSYLRAGLGTNPRMTSSEV